jgi:hypothetical protein
MTKGYFAEVSSYIQKILIIKVILNGALRSEESQGLKRKILALRMTNISLLIALWHQKVAQAFQPMLTQANLYFGRLRPSSGLAESYFPNKKFPDPGE